MFSPTTTSSSATTSPKQHLYDLLNQITDPDVLILHAEYLAATNKQKFYAAFENHGGKSQPARDIFLFEKWLRYRGIYLALSFLGYQKQQLQQRDAYNKHIAASITAELEAYEQAKKLKVAVYEAYLATTTDNPPLQPVYYTPEVPDAVLFTPAIPETIADVIQRDKINQVKIEDSIAKLRQICLQIIGTEHPTDPLSQEAHDILSSIAKEVVNDQPSDQKLIKLLKKLQASDPIPDVRREVHEEVSRDKKATANRFYDNLPKFTGTIFAAYDKYYGVKLTTQYRDTIWQALEGGLQPDKKITSPIVSDASWAAGDAEGNDNVDPPATRVAIADVRKMAAEKHAKTIQNIIKIAKSHERKLRDAIPHLHNDKFDYVKQLTLDMGIITLFQRFQTNVSQYLIHRNFGGLVGYYAQAQKELDKAIKDVIPIPNETQQKIIDEINLIYKKQGDLAQQLHTLTLFSGSYQENIIALENSELLEEDIEENEEFSDNEDMLNGEQLADGALGKFQKIFHEIIKRVGDNRNSSFIKQNDLAAVLERLDKILQDHQLVMQTFPDIYQKMRDFRLQLLCYRMSLGYMHIRQDSSVLMRIWDLLLHDVKPGPQRFLEMRALDQAALMEQLLDESQASMQLLETIYQRWKTQHYNDKAFHEVCRELERMELALTNPDIFELWIMSNTGSLANILSLLVFKKIFFQLPRHQLHIVPLLENLADLQGSPELLEKYIRVLILENFRHHGRKDLVAALQHLSDDQFKIAIQPHQHLITNRVEVMFGYSDSERGSGLTTLITVDMKEEVFVALANGYQIPWRIFDGAGGDLFRGGSDLARRKQKFTGQGNFRDNEYGTAVTASHFRETQFANSFMDLTEGKLNYKDLQPSVIAHLEQFCRDSSSYFEYFLNTENGYGGLVGLTFGWGVEATAKLLNWSSRGDTRARNLTLKNHSDPSKDVQTGGKDNEGFIDPAPLRAIAASQLYEMLRLYMHIIIGPSHAMQGLHEDKDRCAAMVKSLYFLSPAFQDIYEKLLYGLSAVNFDIAYDAYFMDRPDLRPADEQQRAAWLLEAKGFGGKYAKTTVKTLLKTPQGREELLVALSRLFVLIEDEFNRAREFLAQTNKMIFAGKYLNNNLAKISENTDLLHHNPQLAEHMKDVWQNAASLNGLLARISHHLAHNRKLDWVYNVGKDVKVLGSKLSIIARLLGDLLTGLTSARILTLNVDVRRPIPKGQRNMEKVATTFASLPPALMPKGQELAAGSVLRRYVPEEVKNSYSLFNKGKPEKERIDPFEPAMVVKRNGRR